MGQRILILLGDAGGGHMSAAKAIAEAFSQTDPQSEVSIVNLSETEKSFPFNTTDHSWKLVSRYPLLENISDFAYNITNTALADSLAKTLVASDGQKAVVKAIKQYQPDIVISTYFIVSAILENIKAKFPGLFTVSIVCDLVGFPRLLADKNADLVFCPTAEAAERLVQFDVKPERIRYPYFPLRSIQQSTISRDEFLRSLNLDPDLKTVLVTGGGVGTVSMLPTITKLLESQYLQTIVICGNSEASYNLLDGEFGSNPRLHLEKFVSNMPDFLTASDVILAKPGPATIIEIEALGKKAIFSRIVGKQEEGNIPFLKQNPNFIYAPERYEEIEVLINELLQKDYHPFAPRFGADASMQMVSTIQQAFHAAKESPRLS